MYRIIILIISLPIISFSEAIPTELYPDTFSFGIVNRISGQNLIFGKDSSSKNTVLTTTILELYYGTPFSFFYSGLKIAVPISPTNYEDYASNYSLKQINSITTGFSLGGGYGFLFSKHHLKIIFTVNMDVGILNPYFSTQNPSQQLVWGTEILFRYQYAIYKKISLILGIDIGIQIHTKTLEEIYNKEISGISLLYGAVVGFGF